jgi:hypothetical protein
VTSFNSLRSRANSRSVRSTLPLVAEMSLSTYTVVVQPFGLAQLHAFVTLPGDSQLVAVAVLRLTQIDGDAHGRHWISPVWQRCAASCWLMSSMSTLVYPQNSQACQLANSSRRPIREHECAAASSIAAGVNPWLEITHHRSLRLERWSAAMFPHWLRS